MTKSIPIHYTAPPQVDVQFEIPTCNVPMLAVSEKEVTDRVDKLLSQLADPTADTITLLATRLARTELYVQRLYSLLNNNSSISFTMRQPRVLETIDGERFVIE